MKYNAPADLSRVIKAHAVWRGKRDRTVAVQLFISLKSGPGQHGLRHIFNLRRGNCVLPRLRIDAVKVDNVRVERDSVCNGQRLRLIHRSTSPPKLGRLALNRPEMFPRIPATSIAAPNYRRSHANRQSVMADPKPCSLSLPTWRRNSSTIIRETC